MSRKRKELPGWKQLILGEEPTVAVPEPTPAKTTSPKSNRVEWIRQREQELVDSGMTHDQALDVIAREIEEHKELTS